MKRDEERRKTKRKKQQLKPYVPKAIFEFLNNFDSASIGEPNNVR